MCVPLLTVSDIVSDPALDLLSGTDDSVSRPIRWVHVSEHEDPGPWISGGELVLTTGYNLHDEDRQRRFVQRLAENEVAALGFGIGFDHDEVPDAMVETSRKLDLPLIRVSYDMPFISIIENASIKLLDEKHEALLRSQKIHGQLEKELIDGADLDRILQILATETQGAAWVTDTTGRVLASSGGVESDPETVARELRQRARDGRISPFNPESSARPTLAFPIPGSPPGSDCDWLLFESRSDGPPGQFETHLTKSCASVCGLHRMKSEAGLQTERRIGADLLRAALEGEASPRETASKLDALELGHDVAVLAFASGEPQDAVRLLESEARRRDLAAVIATGTPLDPALACVVLGEASGDPVREAGRLLEVLRETEPTARVGVSSPRPGAELARAFHEARASLMADAMSPDPPPVATRDDLGALSLIFAMSEDDSLRTFVSTVLEPIGDPEDPFTQELLHSLEAFLDCNGGWEKASRKLYCHRHTLRYRMNRIEELTGRDLGRVRDRFDFWLALKFRGMAIGAATKA